MMTIREFQGAEILNAGRHGGSKKGKAGGVRSEHRLAEWREVGKAGGVKAREGEQQRGCIYGNGVNCWYSNKTKTFSFIIYFYLNQAK